MSFGSNLGRAQLDMLAENPTLGLDEALRRWGLDPDRSYLGQYARERGKYLAPLYQLSGFGNQNAINELPGMIDQFARGMMQPGGNPLGNVDPNQLYGRFTNAQPNTAEYQFLNTGDPQADLNNLQALRGLQNFNANSLYAKTQDNLLQQQYNRLLGGLATGTINPNMTLLDYVMGRQPSAPQASPPVPVPTPGPAPAPVSPAPTTPPPASPPGTPPATTPPPGGGVNFEADPNYHRLKRLQQGHPAQGGSSSWEFAGIRYSAPDDRRRGYTDSNGNKRASGVSAFNVFMGRIGQLLSTGQAQTVDQAIHLAGRWAAERFGAAGGFTVTGNYGGQGSAGTGGPFRYF